MLRKIIAAFFPGDEVAEVNPYGNGHINDTYKVVFEGGVENDELYSRLLW